MYTVLLKLTKYCFTYTGAGLGLSIGKHQAKYEVTCNFRLYLELSLMHKVCHIY